MKKLFIIIALIAAVLALILSVLPLSNLAYIPSILALASGITALIIHKEKPGKKTIRLAFLLTVIALCFSVYKSIFTVSEVGDTTEFEEKTAQSVEESIETLENEIDIIDEEPVVTNETETQPRMASCEPHAEKSVDGSANCLAPRARKKLRMPADA